MVKASPVLMLMVLLFVKLILPDQELVTSDRVPPFKTRALATTATLDKSKVAPLLTVTAPPVLAPKPVALLMVRVPPLIVVVQV